MEQSGRQLRDPSAAKMSGYLEKKGKMRMVSSWKKYWFVLEGRLLLYYRSRVEYETLSPCKGSINLCPPCEVRPIPSSAGVFQITTRSTTVNLRADDRSEQEKWMQALVGVLNAQSSACRTKRMTHFRYSLDDLVPATSPLKLGRQNTMPHRQKTPTKDCIIQRVQQLGGQSYGGSLGTIAKFLDNKSKKFSPKIPHNRNVMRMLENSTSDTESSPDVTRIDVLLRSEEHLYATVDKRSSLNSSRMNSLMLENQDQNKNSVAVDNEVHVRSKRNSVDVSHLKKSLIVDNDVYCTSVRGAEDVGPNEIILDNEVYVRSRNDSTSHSRTTNSFITDNENYCGFEGKKSSATNSSENIYDVYEKVDYKLADRNSTDSDQLYEDPDQMRIASRLDARSNSFQLGEPILPPRRDDTRISSNSNPDEKLHPTSHQSQDVKSSFKSRLKRIKQMVHSDKKQHDKLKKRSLSFVSKVLGRKKTPNDGQVNVEIGDPLYATVDYVECQESQKKNVLENDLVAATLAQLQKKLVDKKMELEEILKSGKMLSNADSDEEESSKHDDVILRKTDEYAQVTKPHLPPRKSRSTSPFHDVPKNNRPVMSMEKSSVGIKQGLTKIDQILDDLDQEKKARASGVADLTVKQLIEKFSVPKTGENNNEVVLRRRNSRRDVVSRNSDNVTASKGLEEIGERRHSDELNKLLEELTKVTSAPLMTPGVTISLANDNLTDDEWLMLVPVRRRRCSDPDYDVPRPHRSLQFLPRNEPSEAVIPATRFFGPVLAQIPSESSTRCNTVETSMSWGSMAPDSLEPLQILQAAQKAQERKDNEQFDSNRGIINYPAQDKTEKTFSPRIISTISIKEECFSKNQDVFVDSLEPFPEVSTAF